MAGITNPLSSAMKTRAKAAVDAIGNGSPDYASRTPRQLRALILSQDDSDAVRAAMKTEGWFTAGSGTFHASANTAVDVT